MPVIQSIIDQVWLTWRLLLDNRVPIWMKAVVLLPLVYVLSPIDFIPDFFPVVGQLDDIGIILAAMRLFESLVPENIVAEHRTHLSHGDGFNTVEGKTTPRRRQQNKETSK